ncbi:hypothetical protein ACFL0I_02575 [Gemmatimonadota bacterium]
MERLNLREVFGIDDGSMNWGQVAMLSFAFLLSGHLADYLQGVPFSFWHAGILYFLSFLLLAVVLFRLVPLTWVALVVASVAHAPFAYVYQRFLGASPEVLEMVSSASWFITAALRWFAPLGLVALGLRFIKKPLIALMGGPWIGWLLVDGIRGYLDLGGVVAFLVQGAVLGALLWLGLRLTRRPADTDGTLPLSRSFFLGTLTATVGIITFYSAVVILGTLFDLWGVREGRTALWGILAFSMLVGLYGAVVLWVFVYRMWANIQDGHARTSPGKAVGFIFIPFFNFYWIFQVFPGFAKDFNAFILRHSLDIQPLPVGLYRAYAVLLLLTAIPLLGMLTALASYFVLLPLVAKTCNGVNAIGVQAA